MGLLDDAIREHLELKRRRGGDPAEIERAEREALGPVRKQPETAEPEAFDGEAGSERDLDYAFDPEHELDAPELPEFEPELDERGPAAAAPTHPSEPEVPSVSRREFVDPEDEIEPAPSPPPHRAGDVSAEEELAPPRDDPEDQLTQETVEYQVVDEDEADHEPGPPAHERAPAAHEPAEEDVLEETPEFLQDAPEHDRLWFEQRPPKDFDFDG